MSSARLSTICARRPSPPERGEAHPALRRGGTDGRDGSAFVAPRTPPLP